MGTKTHKDNFPKLNEKGSEQDTASNPTSTAQA